MLEKAEDAVHHGNGNIPAEAAVIRLVRAAGLPQLRRPRRRRDPHCRQVKKLITAFSDRGRAHAWKYLPEPCPQVEPALLAQDSLEMLHISR
jgi:hypothetical protein